MDYNQASVGIRNAIAVMAVEDKPALVALLKKHGSMVTELSTTDQILDGTFKAIKDSKRFREDLGNYISSNLKAVGLSDESESGFSNAGGDGWKKVGTALSNFGKTVFSKENIDTAVKGGLAYYSTKLATQAQRSGNQQAIDFEKAQADKFLAEATARSASPTGTLQGEKSKNKWLVPVLIGGGVLVLGVVIYFVARKKN